MSFSLPKFLRQAPAESLQTYFDERKILQAASIQWDASSRRLVDTLRVMIEGLSDRDRERVYDDFERVCLIADDTGQLALRVMVSDAPELLDAISEMDSHEGRGLLVLLRRPDAFDHAHGFRSSFRDWVAERTTFPTEVAEMALAHTVSDKVEAAYRRDDLFEKRRHLAEAWSKYCTRTPIPAGQVIGDSAIKSRRVFAGTTAGLSSPSRTRS